MVPSIVEFELDETIDSWRRAVFTPGQAPLQESEATAEPRRDLLAGLVRSLADDGALEELRREPEGLQDLALGLRDAPDTAIRLSLKSALKRAAQGRPGSIRLVLVVDQLEELFTDPAIDEDERVAFVNALDALARCGSVWIMATVRSDFYQQCESLPVLMRMKGGGGQYDVLQPEIDALRRIITEPARLAGLEFEQKDERRLDSVILNDAAQHPELLPLLEYMLLQLYRESRIEGDRRILTFEAYDMFADYSQDGTKVGGIQGALARKAEETFRSANPSDVTFSAVMNALISLGGDDDESAVKRRAGRTEICDTPEKTAFVDFFVEARLFVSEGSEVEGESSALVAVAHEALFRVWKKAVDWIEGNREFLRTRSQVAQRMQQGGALLSGDPLLERARAQLQLDEERFDPEQRTFIETGAPGFRAEGEAVKGNSQLGHLRPVGSLTDSTCRDSTLP